MSAPPWFTERSDVLPGLQKLSHQTREAEADYVVCLSVAELRAIVAELAAARASAPDGAAAMREAAAKKCDEVAAVLSEHSTRAKLSADHDAMYRANTAWHNVVGLAERIRTLPLPAASPSALALATQEELENVRYAVECALMGKAAVPLFQVEKAILRRFLARLPVRDAGEAG